MKEQSELDKQKEILHIFEVYSSLVNIIYNYSKKNFPNYVGRIRKKLDSFNDDSKKIKIVLQDSKIKFLTKDKNVVLTREDIINFLNPLITKIYLMIKKASGSYNREEPFINIMKNFYRENKKNIDELKIIFPDCFKEDIGKLISEDRNDQIFFE